MRSSGWALSEVESLSLEGESISCLGDSFAGVGRLVYLSLARNNITSLLVSAALISSSNTSSRGFKARNPVRIGRESAGWRLVGAEQHLMSVSCFW